MATHDPKSRLTGGSATSPYASPNGVSEQQGNEGTTSDPYTTGRDVGAGHDESPGEKIGRFFRRAMDRIAGRDEEDWRRGDDRTRSQSEWSDLGRSRDGGNESDRAGPSGDTGGSHERLQSGARPYPGRPAYSAGQGSIGQRSYGRDQAYDRGSQTLGQRALGRSAGEGGGGRDRGLGVDRNREEWGRERGMPGGYAGSGASFGSEADEQHRRFWQREPLAARDVMTRNPKTVTRQTSMREAAVIMRDENCGVVPVVDGAGRLQGILTDRDIVVRGLVDLGGERRIEDVMTDDVSAVTEDEPLTSVLDLMGGRQIRRVPVVDRNDRLLGIISMADIANRADYDEDLQDAFERISSRRSFWSLFS